ncbi:MAG: hypothetical protein IPL08_12655 [Saprospiraceae bacterium]|nr:hypothetical protein [Saprospiraceae bacterium]
MVYWTIGGYPATLFLLTQGSEIGSIIISKPYQQLHESDRSKFEYRMTLYIEGRLFSSVGSELRDVPEDIKCMVAAHGIEMCLGIDDYLIGDMDRIYLYKHPFPTPDFPFLHTVETNIEDGVIILSLEQLTNAVISPETHYNIGYHAYAEAFIGTQKRHNLSFGAGWF